MGRAEEGERERERGAREVGRDVGERKVGKRIESSGLISKQGKQYGEMLMRLYYG